MLAVVALASIASASVQSSTFPNRTKFYIFIGLGCGASILIIAGLCIAAAGARRVLDNVARAYLRARAWNRRLVDVFASLVVWTSVRLFLFGYHVRPSIAAEIGIDLILYVLSLFFVFELQRMGGAKLFRRVDAIGALAQGPARAAIMAVLDQHLETLRQTVMRLQTAVGRRMNQPEVATWTEICFEHGAFRYSGADSNYPSRYYDLYPTYLSSHEKMLQKHNLDDPGKRILIVTPDELRSDRHHNPDRYRDFLTWHAQSKVSLEYIPPGEAESLRITHDLPTTDIGLWRRQYALLFKPVEETGDVFLAMRFPGDAEFTRCEEYLAALEEAARPVDEVVSIFPRAMAEAWPDYVDPPRRLDDLGPFLKSLLAPYGANARILDAAAGIGTDAIWLMENGFADVTTNEIEPGLSKRLRQNFERAGYPGAQFLESDWRDLKQSYPLPVFDAILVLGNSLCLVDDPDDLYVCIEQFYELLRPGGTLIVDERNWAYLLQERDVILRDPLHNFVQPKVMYRGTSVRSCPDSINHDEVVLLFYHNRPSVKTVDDARKVENFIGTISTFPILEPSLGTLLSKCGFDVTTYSDLKAVTPRDPEATFYTYAARRPADQPQQEALRQPSFDREVPSDGGPL